MTNNHDPRKVLTMSLLLLAALLGLPTVGNASIAPAAAVQPLEDHRLFNCHMHGNGVCGPGTPWHGFVNLSE